ncbi:hypothetical protein PF008_g22604 [Phytophthora fragariae]|uniref:Secreted protein n=1 Tax=Phytophthora fragariae TaxID=53985 RepID=A0A6G0QT87_9STRA|nr:hypothetical protein PF008_g22604 [Phytophthora fragariae]
MLFVLIFLQRAALTVSVRREFPAAAPRRLRRKWRRPCGILLGDVIGFRRGCNKRVGEGRPCPFVSLDIEKNELFCPCRCVQKLAHTFHQISY